MQIGRLHQHCGECGVINYCGYSFGFCLCARKRWRKTREEDYLREAAKTVVGRCPHCDGCEDAGPDCDCDAWRDWFCEQVEAQVERALFG